MDVRALAESDISQWAELRAALWTDQPRNELEADGRVALAKDPPLVVFVAEDESVLAGFIEFGFRSVAEGCESSPVPYVEGWFVRESYRRRGIGAALMRAVEDWCRARGFVELGSDANASNRLSRDVHAALGFEEVETLVVFRRVL